MESSQSARCTRIINSLLAALALALLSCVLWQDNDQIREVLDQRIDLRLLGLVIFTSQLGLLTTFLRWYILVRVIEPGFRLRATMLLCFIGYVFNLVIPGAVGGDIVKASYLRRCMSGRPRRSPRSCSIGFSVYSGCSHWRP